jgi:alpha/beta superfamily hydrolase
VSGSVALVTSDGITLAGELARASTPRAQAVLCHPHPQFGGTMRSLVISELFAALPTVGVTCLRFDFRGAGTSAGAFDHGRGERDDVRTALAALRADDAALPTYLVGWSFGADLALSVRDPGHQGWVGIALPMRWLDDGEATGADPRPKLVLLAEHDEFRAPAEVAAVTSTWSNAETEIVGGASHFFVGRTARLVERVQDFVLPAEDAGGPGPRP